MDRLLVEMNMADDELMLIMDCLIQNPPLKTRFARLVNLFQNGVENLERADDAECQVRDESRALNHEILQGWAQNRANQKSLELAATGAVTRHFKKKVHWFSLFGEIEVDEQTYVNKSDGKLQRPFQKAAEVSCRGYSMPLQRAITDFGADSSFGRVPDKIREHYGVEIPRSGVRTITEMHAEAFTEELMMPEVRESAEEMILIGEMDGSMIPIVDTQPTAEQAVESPPTDLRRARKVFWKEAKLGLVRRNGEIEPVFAVTMGGPAEAGQDMKRLADAQGMNSKTKLHALGDGAPWIEDQIEQQFGAQGSYTIDFYHVCDYLALAAKVCDKERPAQWMELQKQRLKTGRLNEVIDALRLSQEPEAVPIENAPVRQCLRYFENRPGQFKYQECLAAGLPIGSGEVESAHRYIIQKRLKLPGAWWKVENAQAMLNLRTARANKRWDSYWDKLAA